MKGDLADSIKRGHLNQVIHFGVRPTRLFLDLSGLLGQTPSLGPFLIPRCNLGTGPRTTIMMIRVSRLRLPVLRDPHSLTF